MALAQPQPLVLAQHLRGAADQCALLGNLPAINNAQMLQNIMNAADNIGVRITAIEVSMGDLNTRVSALDESIASRMQAMGHNSQAHLYNSELSSSEQALKTIRTSANVELAGFPLNSS